MKGLDDYFESGGGGGGNVRAPILGFPHPQPL